MKRMYASPEYLSSQIGNKKQFYSLFSLDCEPCICNMIEWTYICSHTKYDEYTLCKSFLEGRRRPIGAFWNKCSKILEYDKEVC
ncbi:unnamed protein product [Moneuplotes crassus]|uniref:Uncharacterized protein n=1 Tax=Euplotes crassus TaxID=5936 RepID=A0AAD1X7M2_EUPCR|nr:unnamed protein product [Moneuplotes crassus]